MLVIGPVGNLGGNRNLGNLSSEELDQTWRALFGSERPRRVCGDLLIKALGYRLQEKAIGGLKPSTRHLLERWGRNGSERGPLAEPARTPLKAGTVLVREWHGVTHRVTVLDDGVDFLGERFRSLSDRAKDHGYTLVGSALLRPEDRGKGAKPWSGVSL